MPRVPSSLYPTSSSSSSHQSQKEVLLRIAEPWTWIDDAIISASSLVLVGSWIWVPALYVWSYKKWKSLSAPSQKRQRTMMGVLLLSLTTIVLIGPQRHPKFAKWVRFRKWKIWNYWCRFVAFEVWRDTKQQSTASTPQQPSTNHTGHPQQSISAFVPHGIFPFVIGVGGIPDIATKAFGKFRIMVATATNLFPVVRDIISLVNAVDASRPVVDRALSQGDSIGLLPGGIPEMFEGYPTKPLSHPDDEFAIVPKGFLKMGLRHQLPVRPIYCFGSTKMLKRLPLPQIVERISLLFRISLCVFYGKYGFPVPFRQRFLYIMGDSINANNTNNADQSTTSQQQSSTATTAASASANNDDDALVNELHQQFCNELMRIFENNKELYGWGHKTLHLLSR